MDRPSRNRKAVDYSVFQEDDDEDFACVKPPPKKARTDVKDLVLERNLRTTSASPNEVVDITSSGSRKRTSLNEKLYDRDLEAALTLSLLDSSKTQDEETTANTDNRDASQSVQCSPPVLTHCSADGSHLEGESHPHPDYPPVLSNCSIDDKSLGKAGLNLISMDASPPSFSKQTEASEKQRKPLKEKDNKDDVEYQPQNAPDSESDADFTEEDESEDETFTVKKKQTVNIKTEKKAPPPVKGKKEKKEKKPAKAKNSAPSPAICQSPAAPLAGLKKTPNTPPIPKPALCSSPAGGKVPKWNPPGLVGRSPGGSQNAPMKSPGQGLRLGLSRMARVKHLHPNAAVN